MLVTLTDECVAIVSCLESLKGPLRGATVFTHCFVLSY